MWKASLQLLIILFLVKVIQEKIPNNIEYVYGRTGRIIGFYDLVSVFMLILGSFLSKIMVSRLGVARIRWLFQIFMSLSFILEKGLYFYAHILGPLVGPNLFYVVNVYPQLILGGSLIGKSLAGILPVGVWLNALIAIVLSFTVAIYNLPVIGQLWSCHYRVISYVLASIYAIPFSIRNKGKFVIIMAYTAAVLWWTQTQCYHCTFFPPKYPLRISENVKVLTQTESVTGWMSVVDDETIGARMLRSGASVIGGVFHHSNETIFAMFYFMEYMRLAKEKESPNPRALQIGFGIGCTSNAFQRHGIKVDIVEIDPVVYEYAKNYFPFNLHNSSVYLFDALKVIPTLPNKTYDYIIHDVFTGGSLPKPLFTIPFLQSVKAKLKTSGLLGMNYVGNHKELYFRTLLARLFSIFNHVRIFGDEFENHSIRNLIFFASDEPIRFRKPKAADYLGSEERKNVFITFVKQEILISRDELDIVGSEDLYYPISNSVDHWYIIRLGYPNDILYTF